MRVARYVSLAACISTCLVAASGCGGSSRLFDLHFAKDRRADADNRWREVRARVKRQLAQQLYDAGDLKAARTELRQALVLNAEDSQAYLLLAKVELRDGQLDAAEKAAYAALSLPDGGAEAEYVMGVVSERCDRPEKAAEWYARAMDANPAEAEYVVALAETTARGGRPVEALGLAEAKLPDFEHHAGLRLVIAGIYQLLGLQDSAIRALQQAERVCGQDPMVEEQLGIALALAGRHHEAIEILEPLVQQASAGTRQARAAKRAAQLSDGAAAFRTRDAAEVCDTPGSSPAVRRLLARCYLACRMNDAAFEVLKALLAENGNDADGWLSLAECGMARGDPQLAMESARRTTHLNPDDKRAYYILAYCAQGSGDHQSAAEALDGIRRVGSDDVLGLCIVAHVAVAQGNVAQAEASIKRALELEPDNPAAIAIREHLRADSARPSAQLPPAGQLAPPGDSQALSQPGSCAPGGTR